MNQLTQNLIGKILKESPYEGFNHQDYPQDVQGWGSQHPIFQRVMGAIKPALVLEVGTWKGASALHMASLLKAQSQEKGGDRAIICIDTWLGGLEHIDY